MTKLFIGNRSLWALLLLPLLPACAPSRSTARPGLRSNILLIIADDLGNDKIGIYQEGDDLTRPRTPNIDALARRGLRFTNAYAYAACSPTRASILTGQYGFRTGIGAVILRQDSYILPIHPKTVPIPIMLKRGAAGYDTSQIGKWHLATRAVGGLANPLQHGFEYTAGPRGNVPSYFAWPKQVNGELERATGYVTSDTTDDAAARANAMSEPWFLWVAYNAGHEPFHVPPANLHHQQEAEGNDVLMYTAMIEALDAELGRLFESIDPDVFARTTVIFLGDNGTPNGALRPPYDERRTKGSINEGGTNVPLIVAGRLAPKENHGRVCDALVNTTDLYATVADIAGVNLSDVLPPGHMLDSKSILPLLERPNDQRSIRQVAYTERFKPNGRPPYELWQRAVRDKRWKLVRESRRGRTVRRGEQFFDLDAAEPGEDGKNLCPCPRGLEGEALQAYRRLEKALEEISGP